MDATAYLQAFITVGGAIMGIWGFVKVMKDIKKNSDEEHDRRQRWDHAASVIEEKEKKWDEGLADIYQERSHIVNLYNGRLDELDARTQQLYAMLGLLIRAVNAILEREIQNGANSEVKEMHKELNKFITDQLGK